MILTNIGIYLLIGALWSAWLEYFCVKELEDPYNRPFTAKERLVHIACWPLTLTSFIYHFIKDYFG